MHGASHPQSPMSSESIFFCDGCEELAFVFAVLMVLFSVPCVSLHGSSFVVAPRTPRFIFCRVSRLCSLRVRPLAFCVSSPHSPYLLSLLF